MDEDIRHDIHLNVYFVYYPFRCVLYTPKQPTHSSYASVFLAIRFSYDIVHCLFDDDSYFARVLLDENGINFAVMCMNDLWRPCARLQDIFIPAGMESTTTVFVWGVGGRGRRGDDKVAMVVVERL